MNIFHTYLSLGFPCLHPHTSVFFSFLNIELKSWLTRKCFIIFLLKNNLPMSHWPPSTEPPTPTYHGYSLLCHSLFALATINILGTEDITGSFPDSLHGTETCAPVHKAFFVSVAWVNELSKSRKALQIRLSLTFCVLYLVSWGWGLLSVSSRNLTRLISFQNILDMITDRDMILAQVRLSMGGWFFLVTCGYELIHLYISV